MSLFGRTPRTKAPAQFLRELEAVRETGYRGTVFIVDDNFIGNKAAVKELLTSVIAWQKEKKRPFQFCTEASVNLAADSVLLDLMVEAGFNMVFLGIETPAEESLEAVGKTQNLKGDILAAVKTIQGRGIEVTGGFIVGFDTDPADIFERQIDFIRELAVPIAMVGLLTALPKTKLHRRLAEEGRLVASSNGNNTHSLDMNFKPRLPVRVLKDGYLKILETIYDPGIYFERCLAFFDRLPSTKSTHVEGRGGGTFTKSNAQALVLSILIQTFSSYGLAYLKYLAKALWKHPDQFVRIFAMAIQGHHLFKITRLILSTRPSYGKKRKLSSLLEQAPALQLQPLRDTMKSGTASPSAILSNEE